MQTGKLVGETEKAFKVLVVVENAVGEFKRTLFVPKSNSKVVDGVVLLKNWLFNSKVKELETELHQVYAMSL